MNALKQWFYARTLRLHSKARAKRLVLRAAGKEPDGIYLFPLWERVLVGSTLLLFAAILDRLLMIARVNNCDDPLAEAAWRHTRETTVWYDRAILIAADTILIVGAHISLRRS